MLLARPSICTFNNRLSSHLPGDNITKTVPILISMIVGARLELSVDHRYQYNRYMTLDDDQLKKKKNM